MPQRKSPLLAAVHETAAGLRQAGAIDQVTMREFDRMCLQPVEPLEPEQIRQLRERSRVSQAVFARLLNTSVSTVQKWETGAKHPSGPALKLLNLVHRRGLDAIS